MMQCVRVIGCSVPQVSQWRMGMPVCVVRSASIWLSSVCGGAGGAGDEGVAAAEDVAHGLLAVSAVGRGAAHGAHGAGGECHGDDEGF